MTRQLLKNKTRITKQRNAIDPYKGQEARDKVVRQSLLDN